MADSFEAAKKSVSADKTKKHSLKACGTALCNAKPVKEGCKNCDPNNYVKYGEDSIWDWRLPENAVSYVGDDGEKDHEANAFDTETKCTGILSKGNNK